VTPQGILAFIVALSTLVLVHEFGHFVVAKWAGIRVESFSIFFGRPVFAVRKAERGGWQFRSFAWRWGVPDEAFEGGETEYAIRWIPFGGYVKMAGQEDLGEAEITGQPWEFTSKPVSKRAAVIFAGPFMNFILAVVMFTWLNMHYGIVGRIGIGPAPEMRVKTVEAGSRADSLGVKPGAKWVSVNGQLLTTWEALAKELKDAEQVTIELASPSGRTLTVAVKHDLSDLYEFGVTWETDAVVGTLIPLEPAGEAGVRLGDRILSVDGEAVDSWTAMSALVRRSPDRPVTLEVEREGRRRFIEVTPSMEIAAEQPEDGVRLPPFSALQTGIRQTWIVTVKIVRFIERVISGVLSPKYLAGPVGILHMTEVAAQRGLATYLVLVATLSANLGFINLLPLLVLDGGHLAILGFEGLTGKRPSARQQGIMQHVGIVFLVGLMIMVTIIDLERLF